MNLCGCFNLTQIPPDTPLEVGEPEKPVQVIDNRASHHPGAALSIQSLLGSSIFANAVIAAAEKSEGEMPGPAADPLN